MRTVTYVLHYTHIKTYFLRGKSDSVYLKRGRSRSNDFYFTYCECFVLDFFWMHFRPSLKHCPCFQRRLITSVKISTVFNRTIVQPLLLSCQHIRIYRSSKYSAVTPSINVREVRYYTLRILIFGTVPFFLHCPLLCSHLERKFRFLNMQPTHTVCLTRATKTGRLGWIPGQVIPKT